MDGPSGSISLSLTAASQKARGTCSISGTIRQLHNRDGKVHLHGPHKNPCPGSHKPPRESSDTVNPRASEEGAARGHEFIDPPTPQPFIPGGGPRMRMVGGENPT